MPCDKIVERRMRSLNWRERYGTFSLLDTGEEEPQVGRSGGVRETEGYLPNQISFHKRNEYSNPRLGGYILA